MDKLIYPTLDHVVPKLFSPHISRTLTRSSVYPNVLLKYYIHYNKYRQNMTGGSSKYEEFVVKIYEKGR